MGKFDITEDEKSERYNHRCIEDTLITKIEFVIKNILLKYFQSESYHEKGDLNWGYKEKYILHDDDKERFESVGYFYDDILQYCKQISNYKEFREDIILFCKEKLGEEGKKILEEGREEGTIEDISKATVDDFYKKTVLSEEDVVKYIILHRIPSNRALTDIRKELYNIRYIEQTTLQYRNVAHTYLTRYDYLRIIFKLIIEAEQKSGVNTPVDFY